MSNGYRTITQRVRAPQRTERRYTPYQKRGGNYKRKFSKASLLSYTRTGRRLFRRDVAKIVEENAEPKYDENTEYYDEVTNIFDNSVYRGGRRISFCGGIIPGSGNYGNRIGNRITLTSLQMRLVVTPWVPSQGDIAADLNTVFYLRMIIFTWRDDSEPTLTEILQFSDEGGVPDMYSNVMCPLNFDKKVKRKILYDEVHTFYMNYAPGTFVAVNWDPVRYLNIYIPIRKFRQVYYSNEDVPEQIGVNKIYCWLISNVTDPSYSVFGVGKSWPIYCYWRINYKDV